MRYWTVALALFIPLLCFAQPTNVSVESYAELKEISKIAISPSGNRIAFRRTDGIRDFIIAIDKANNARLGLVDVSQVKPNFIYFIDENKIILIATQNTILGGFRGRHEVSMAAVYNLETKKLHRLLQPGNGIYKGQTQLGRVVGVSPERDYAYMPAFETPGRFNLYRVNLKKDRKPRVHQKGGADTIDFFVDDQGEVLARERYDNRQDLHRIESKIDGDWVEIFSEETEFRTKGFRGLTPDYKSLVFRSQDESHGRWAFYTMALRDGEIAGPFFSHPDKDVEEILTDINRVVHGVRYSGFVPSYDFFDEKLNARMRGIAQAMPNNGFAIVDHTPDWQQIVFYMDGDQSSGDYILYQEGALGLLAPSRKDIAPEAVHPVTIYNYEARDGRTIPALLTTPLNTEVKNLPAIMYPHGGPEDYDRKGFDYFAQYFANQGYVVLQPQFRGSKGFGPEHLFAGRGEWGRKMQDDLTDAVSDAIAKGMIDPNRVCIVGASYGGYAALAGATFTPDVYTCAVSINGVSDVEKMLKDEKRDHGRDHWVVSYWNRVIAAGNVEDNHLHSISPINFVDKVKVPVLLIHGERDKVVRVAQSEDMYDELKDAKKDVTYVELDKGDHYLSDAQNRMKALTTIDAFLKTHL